MFILYLNLANLKLQIPKNYINTSVNLITMIGIIQNLNSVMNKKNK